MAKNESKKRSKKLKVYTVEIVGRVALYIDAKNKKDAKKRVKNHEFNAEDMADLLEVHSVESEPYRAW